VNLLQAELLKARTTRLLLWYGLGLLAFLTFVVSIHLGTDDRSDLATASTQRSLFAVSGLAGVVAILVGTVLLAGEYAHGTINQSFLASPVRERLVAAKLAAAALVGAALGLLAAVAVFVLGEAWYAGRGVTLHLGHGTLTPVLGTVAASALAAAAGVGLAGILRRQTATIVAILLWLLIGENVVAVSANAARYAPGHVFAAIATVHTERTPDALAVWPAVVVALVYVAILAAAGLFAVLGSDAPSQGA
jgi:ABC-2 type transport system permease protein